MTIVGLYATLGLSLHSKHHMGHLWGDVPALLLAAAVVAVLVRSSGIVRADDRSPREVP
jgi:hypothetical protein